VFCTGFAVPVGGTRCTLRDQSSQSIRHRPLDGFTVPLVTGSDTPSPSGHRSSLVSDGPHVPHSPLPLSSSPSMSAGPAQRLTGPCGQRVSRPHVPHSPLPLSTSPNMSAGPAQRRTGPRGQRVSRPHAPHSPLPLSSSPNMSAGPAQRHTGPRGQRVSRRQRLRLLIPTPRNSRK